MAEGFELRTRHQFAGLIERRDRWVLMRDHPDARARFEQLTGLDWAQHNYGLDAGSDRALWEAATPDASGVYMLQAHVAAVQTVLRLADEKEFLCGRRFAGVAPRAALRRPPTSWKISTAGCSTIGCRA